MSDKGEQELERDLREVMMLPQQRQPAATNDEGGIDLDFNEDATPPRCAFVTGAAGTGKTYQAREKIGNDPSEGILCATTGIAGVNLGTVTINSLLRYFDTESLINAFVSGRLVTRLAKLAQSARNLYVDEVSMMPAEQLDTLYQAVREANRRKSVLNSRNPEGLRIVGDEKLLAARCKIDPRVERWI